MMTTHADIWLPLDPKDPDSDLFYCEAWSDGYLDGVAFGCFTSSQRIEDVIKLSKMFAGSPVFHLPSTNRFEIKYDFDFDNMSEEEEIALLPSAREALTSAVAGNIAQAESTQFGQISFEKKLAMGLGLNCYTQTKAALLSRSGPKMQAEEAAQQLCLNHDVFREREVQYQYIWDEGQFWVPVNVEGQERLVPLFFVLAKMAPGCYGDLTYLYHMTDQDQHNFNVLRAEYQKHGQPEAFFGGGEVVASVLLKQVLNQDIQGLDLKDKTKFRL